MVVSVWRLCWWQIVFCDIQAFSRTPAPLPGRCGSMVPSSLGSRDAGAESAEVTSRRDLLVTGLVHVSGKGP